MLKKQILTHIYDKKVFVMENIVESILKKIIIENEYTEGGGRKLSKKTIDYINGETDKLARELYGNKYGKDDKTMQGYFPDNKRKIKNDVDIKGGIFSLGNDKLSDDTLIINFNSALGCPSINDCPITQLACYAVAGENRLPDTKKKHILVQKLVNAARNNNMLEGIFRIAELYIIAAKETPRPIRYIRYNEVGDFVDQKMLELAAKFSRMVKDKYGIISMAYTSKKGIDPSAEIDGEPIDMIIAINRSRNDIPKSPNALNRKFFGIPMPRNGFSVNPNVNLDNAYADVDEVTDNELNKLKVTMPINGSNGYPSVPTLHYGKWSGGEGYYYVCPCSFWKYNKDKAEKEFLVAHGIMTDDEEMPQNSAQRRAFNKRIPKKLKDELKRILKKMNLKMTINYRSDKLKYISEVMEVVRVVSVCLMLMLPFADWYEVRTQVLFLHDYTTETLISCMFPKGWINENNWIQILIFTIVIVHIISLIFRVLALGGSTRLYVWSACTGIVGGLAATISTYGFISLIKASNQDFQDQKGILSTVANGIAAIISPILSGITHIAEQFINSKIVITIFPKLMLGLGILEVILCILLLILHNNKKASREQEIEMYQTTDWWQDYSDNKYDSEI